LRRAEPVSPAAPVDAGAPPATESLAG
jgi:hypothetical protein